MPTHPATRIDDSTMAGHLDALLARLEGNYPFFHPNYLGQMLKPPHPAAVLGYLAAMLHNPNNHALDGGPPTSVMEKELIPKLAAMVGLTESSLGHLTSSGTIANLEALFVARETHPGRGIAFSAQAHYTHARMCHVLGVAGRPVAVDRCGRLDLASVTAACAAGDIGTIVVNAGTTGLGMVDPIAEVRRIATEHDVRVHVDAAYGGFFTILARSGDSALEDLVPAGDLQAIARCDSVVIDPHKHGLQPYGCGAVLFADPLVARFYLHDSPYTYFSSDELHLGEISLECSRAGAAAAALWLTEQVVPWTSDGLGAGLAAGLRAARRFRDRLESSGSLVGYQAGDLDIVTYHARADSMSAIDASSESLFRRSMSDQTSPLFLATYTVTGAEMADRNPAVAIDADQARIMRSVLMKPEQELTIDATVDRLESMVGGS